MAGFVSPAGGHSACAGVDSARVTDVLAVANQKGGVAKTTTVHSLGVASAEFGRRTLVVDLDPQACLTYSLGFDPDALDRSLHDVFVRRDQRGRSRPAGARGGRARSRCRPPSTWPARRSTCSPGPVASTYWSERSSRSSTATTSS